MINSKKTDTSILYGFTRSLLDLIIKEEPTHIGVAFDPPSPTFRHKIFPEYKANRSETPELIKESLEPLIEILNSLSIPVLMKPGFEADDVIGTLAKEAAKESSSLVYMVTPDKDYGQLVQKNIFQLKPLKTGNFQIIDQNHICEQYQIKDPKQVVDILTIWGDSSDNIPGVRGVGEIGSKKLIAQFGSVENIYSSLDMLSAKQREAFEEAKSHIQLSKQLVTIDLNVPIEWSLEQLKLNSLNLDSFQKLIEFYEFQSIRDMIPKLSRLFNISSSNSLDITTPRTKSTQISLLSQIDISSFLKEVTLSKFISFSIIEESILLANDKNYSIVNDDYSRSLFFEFISNSTQITFCGYNTKKLLSIFKKNQIDRRYNLLDIELMHYLISSEISHKIDILSKSYLNIDLAVTENTPQDLFSALDPELKHESIIKETSVYRALSQNLKEQLVNNGQWDLYNNVEMPLIYVLTEMEVNGIKIDIDHLNLYKDSLTKELNQIEDQVREYAGDSNLNVSSPKQLGIIIYEKLKLVQNAKLTSKKNYSTDEETLSSLKESHPIIEKILEYRELKKLISTYIEPLPLLADKKSGKIHTTFNQSLTSTGRLSSIKPNLQNIPIKTERGREIRKAFIPSYEGGYIMSADYSQIELRVMAHMSQDPHFVEAFINNKDIHTATASRIFGVEEENVTREQRTKAKVANFGIIYGISAFGLSQRLSISRKEAKEIIDEYFDKYPKVYEYMQNSISQAKESGYVETILGRKRELPVINSKNPIVRSLSERNAINAPIQGSAADIIKIAMIEVYNTIINRSLKSKLILQVHDELVFDVFPGEESILKDIVTEKMQNAYKLSVPLTVECEMGKNWLEAH